MRVQVAWSPVAGEAHELTLELPEGSRVADALRAAQRPIEPDAAIGIWGRMRPPDHPLADGDRVELYRPLQLDPREARRRRAVPRGKARGRPAAHPPGTRQRTP